MSRVYRHYVATGCLLGTREREQIGEYVAVTEEDAMYQISGASLFRDTIQLEDKGPLRTAYRIRYRNPYYLQKYYTGTDLAPTEAEARRRLDMMLKDGINAWAGWIDHVKISPWGTAMRILARTPHGPRRPSQKARDYRAAIENTL